MTVALVEDHLAYRESFRLAVRTLSSFEIVAEASAAREAYPLIERHEPELAVVDFLLPDSNGVALARELKRRRAKTKVLILGRMAHPLFVRDGLRAGVGGFALKHEPLETIIAAMSAVGRGERYVSPQLEEELRAADPEDALPLLTHLSAREREILCLLVEGQSSKDIARALCLSSKTVDAHRLHINHKLGVRSHAALVRFAADHGLVRV